MYQTSRELISVEWMVQPLTVSIYLSPWYPASLQKVTLKSMGIIIDFAPVNPAVSKSDLSQYPVPNLTQEPSYLVPVYKLILLGSSIAWITAIPPASVVVVNHQLFSQSQNLLPALTDHGIFFASRDFTRKLPNLTCQGISKLCPLLQFPGIHAPTHVLQPVLVLQLCAVSIGPNTFCLSATVFPSTQYFFELSLGLGPAAQKCHSAIVYKSSLPPGIQRYWRYSGFEILTGGKITTLFGSCFLIFLRTATQKLLMFSQSVLQVPDISTKILKESLQEQSLKCVAILPHHYFKWILFCSWSVLSSRLCPWYDKIGQIPLLMQSVTCPFNLSMNTLSGFGQFILILTFLNPSAAKKAGTLELQASIYFLNSDQVTSKPLPICLTQSEARMGSSVSAT